MNGDVLPPTGEMQSNNIAEWFWDRREDVVKSLYRLYHWFRGPSNKKPKVESADTTDSKEQQRAILIVGPGGVGKSTLGGFLSGEFDLITNPPGSYRESLVTELIQFQSKQDEIPGIDLIIPPGQEHRRSSTWGELYGFISSGQFRGVIVIAAYGYHSLGNISWRDHRIKARGKNQFLELFIQDRRRDELSVLKQIVPHVIANQRKMWMLTVVTKQDLWWDNGDSVRQHYEQMEWKRILEQMAVDKSPSQFRHEICYASLVINNFSTGRGEMLKKNTAGYDHANYVGSLRKLVETIDALREWEE